MDSGVLLATVDGTARSLQQSASNWGLLEFRVQVECTLLNSVPIRPQFIVPVVLAAYIVVVFIYPAPISISHLLSAPIQVSEINNNCNQVMFVHVMYLCIIQVLIFDIVD